MLANLGGAGMKTERTTRDLGKSNYLFSLDFTYWHAGLRLVCEEPACTVRSIMGQRRNMLSERIYQIKKRKVGHCIDGLVSSVGLSESRVKI